MNITFDVSQEQSLLISFIAVMVGFVISLVAWNAGYYRLPATSDSDKRFLFGWQYVVVAFGVFISMEIVVVPSFFLLWISYEQGSLVNTSSLHLNPEQQGWLNILAIGSTAVAMLVLYFYLDKHIRRQVWGSAAKSSKWQAWCDFFLGSLTYLIVLPWIIAIGGLIGIGLQFVQEGPRIDQVAVRHIREILNHPALLYLTFVVISTIVPYLEELLFRGFLQTWLKSFFGRTKAIIFTSVIFAFFHYASSQGIDNIELLILLFILSCYLGFLRERQSSLWAPIGLHATFNLISLLAIVFGN